ncbi:MAG: hypothetical protein NTY15_16760 [Planctomycetota bacterium]|nr:hypothetical protein [Planctomycetota bacterium]
MNLRIVWGGPTPTTYVGTLEIDSGTLLCSQQLGIDSNDPSFLLKDATGKFKIHDTKTQFGGCDVHVQAKENNRLTLKLQIEDEETSQTIVKEFVWTLKSLRDGPDTQELGINGCRLSVDSVPGDRLRVVTSRSHLIYNSEEPLSLQIQPHNLPWLSTLCVFECALTRLDDDYLVYRKSKQVALDGFGNGEPYDVLSVAPKDEGVYELRFKIEPKRILPGLMLRYPSIERSVQFVVYNNLSTSKTSQVSTLVSVDEDSSWRPQSQTSPSGFEVQSLTSRLAGRIDNSKRFPFLEIARTLSVLPKETTHEKKSATSDSTVQIPAGGVALASLHNMSPGDLHRLSVYTSSSNAAFRVAIRSAAAHDSKAEPSIANEVFDVSIPRSLDRAVHLSNASPDENFALLFWPSSQAAQLEITNLNPNSVLDLHGVLVDVWDPSTQVPKARLGSFVSPSCILELHSPNVRGAYGVEQVSNATGKRTYDQWQQFLRFAKQSASYCRANGFDALAWTVHSEGSSLFPSSKLSVNARFDTGTFSSEGRDPLRKDVVELMYRVLSRYGIEFIPMLELGSPIHEVEEAFNKVESKELFQHRDELLAQAGSVSRLYNPFCPRVQQAIAVALEEFGNRYRSQPNYRGFALRASPATHFVLSLPIEQTNPSILERFGATLAGNLPKDSSQREQFISQRLKGAYLQWHQEAVTEFLTQLKNRPKWISSDNTPSATLNNHSSFIVNPIEVGPQTNELSSVPATVAAQWNLDRPRLIHVAMDRPVSQFDNAFARLGQIAKQFLDSSNTSLPYRENARSLSKVRIWSSKNGSSALLVSNSGAISESIHIAWGTLPTDYRIQSTLVGESSNSNQRVEINTSSGEWKLQVASGEVIRIDLLPYAGLPTYWYSLETLVARSLDSSLVSIEQAIGRLSVPQPRFATLSNPSFESPNNNSRRGRLSGWTTSIDPNASVEMDSRTATEGKHSVSIESKNPSSIAWIQSDPFAMTPSDRMMVSLQAAADPVPQQVTVSLSKYDPKSDRFETVAVREIADKIQRSSNQVKWGNVGVDMSSEFRAATQNNEPGLFRLQVETAGLASLWLDDIFVSTSFLRDSERRELRSELFLARNSLQSGDSTPAVAMLNSSRGRLVLWSDSSVPNPKVMVSSPVTRETQATSKTPSSDTIMLPESRSEAKAIESAKQRPIKRLRNYWWSRKE